MIAAPASGAGKTTVTLALLAAARRRGLAVRGAKAGPDYIDPAFHAAATGAPSLNLDGWSMDADQLTTTARWATADAELLVVESAMGLFDGVAAPAGRTGAGADLAAALGLPVVLVLDVTGQSQTAAAVAQGLARHRAGVEVAGVILNRTASDRHRDGIVAAMAAAGLPVLGVIPRDAGLALPSRHLGLVQAGEQSDLPARLNALADLAEANLDLDALFALASRVKTSPVGTASDPAPLLRPPGQRIALARDAAFSFLYPHLLEGWRRAGAEIAFFSPLAGEAPPESCDACWLPGGYPELHAGALAAANGFRDGLAAFARTRPVHGECGGYMALGQALEDADGVTHPMAGLLGHATSFARRRLNLGYRRATLLADGPLGPAGSVLRGHEFHYATVSDPGGDEPLARLQDGAGKALGPAGGRRGQVSGGFFHAVCAELG